MARAAPSSAAPPSAPGTGVSRERAVSARAFFIGLALVALMVALTQILQIRYLAGEVGGGAPPPFPTYVLFLWVALALPLLRRFGVGAGLSRGELLLIYTMLLVAGPVSHQFGIGFLIPHMVAPYYYGSETSGWSQFWPHLPAWLGPKDPELATAFFTGTLRRVPWEAWTVPLLAWGALLAALFWTMLCMNVLVRRQWVESERLVFPLAALPLELSRAAERRDGRAGLLGQTAFWYGAATAFGFVSAAALVNYFPALPALTLRGNLLIDTLPDRPWNGIGPIELSIIFWLLGIVYLLPTDVSLSAWLFYWITRLENVWAVAAGTTGEPPSVYSNDFPALFAQGAGAAIALTFMSLYGARRHLGAVLRRAVAGDRSVDDRQEFLSYRLALFGAMLGIAFMLCWLTLAGMRLWVAGILLGLMLCYFFIFARIRAETGLGMGVILAPKMLDEMMATFVGARIMTISDITILHAVRWLFFGSATGAVMAAQLEGLKIADDGGLRRRPAAAAILAALALALVLGLVWTTQTYFAKGFINMPIGQRGLSMVGSQIWWSYQGIVEDVNNPTGPQWRGIAAIGAGGAVAATLALLRMSFWWWPFHPIGFLAANSWGMHINWGMFLLGWLIKVGVTRYGGLILYRRLLPLFLGLIVGDIVAQGLWSFITMAVNAAA